MPHGGGAVRIPFRPDRRTKGCEIHVPERHPLHPNQPIRCLPRPGAGRLSARARYRGLMGTQGAGRRLVLLRHAKSAWPEVADHERPLAKRGRRDAPKVGRWLGTSGYLPDAVVCSTARRARETWDLVSAQLPAAPEVHYEPRVYEASVLSLL